MRAYGVVCYLESQTFNKKGWTLLPDDFIAEAYKRGCCSGIYAFGRD